MTIKIMSKNFQLKKKTALDLSNSLKMGLAKML